MNTTEINEALRAAFAAIMDTYDRLFPGAYLQHERALHGEWCDRSGIPWRLFVHFLNGGAMDEHECAKLIEVAPSMMDHIIAVSDGKEAAPSWAIGLSGFRVEEAEE